LGYSRRFPRATGHSTEEILAAMGSLPGVRTIRHRDSGDHPEPNEITVWLDNAWYGVTLAEPGPVRDVRDSLEAVRLDEEILPSLATALGVDADAAIVPVPTGSADGLRESCVEHGAIGFTPRPPGVSTVTRVAEDGRVMPPKSTWFDPKVRPGLLVREVG